MSVIELKMNRYKNEHFYLHSGKIFYISNFEPLKPIILVFIDNFRIASIVFRLQTFYFKTVVLHEELASNPYGLFTAINSGRSLLFLPRVVVLDSLSLLSAVSTSVNL